MATTVSRIRVYVDEENGCETCWETLRKLEPKLNEESMSFVVKETSFKAVERCRHDAPSYAKSILIRRINGGK